MCVPVCVHFRPCSCFGFVFFRDAVSLFLQQVSNNKNKHGWPNEENTFLLLLFVHSLSRTCSLLQFTCALSRWLACSLTLALNCRAVPVCASSKVNEASTQATLASLSRTCANESGAPLISCIDCTESQREREREFSCASFVAWAESTSALLVGCALRSACVGKRCR